jgi:hypothetical protein
MVLLLWTARSAEQSPGILHRLVPAGRDRQTFPDNGHEVQETPLGQRHGQEATGRIPSLGRAPHGKAVLPAIRRGTILHVER